MTAARYRDIAVPFLLCGNDGAFSVEILVYRQRHRMGLNAAWLPATTTGNAAMRIGR